MAVISSRVDKRAREIFQASPVWLLRSSEEQFLPLHVCQDIAVWDHLMSGCLSRARLLCTQETEESIMDLNLCTKCSVLDFAAFNSMPSLTESSTAFLLMVKGFSRFSLHSNYQCQWPGPNSTYLLFVLEKLSSENSIFYLRLFFA